jgi:hypothetical protein
VAGLGNKNEKFLAQCPSFFWMGKGNTSIGLTLHSVSLAVRENRGCSVVQACLIWSSSVTEVYYYYALEPQTLPSVESVTRLMYAWYFLLIYTPNFFKTEKLTGYCPLNFFKSQHTIK